MIFKFPPPSHLVYEREPLDRLQDPVQTRSCLLALVGIVEEDRAEGDEDAGGGDEAGGEAGEGVVGGAHGDEGLGVGADGGGVDGGRGAEAAHALDYVLHKVGGDHRRHVPVKL